MARRSMVLPLILIGIGVVAFLANLGLLTGDAVDRAVSLWPLILVLVGAELILRRLLAPAPARAAGLALLGLMLLVVVAYAAFGSGSPGGSRSFDSSEPRRDLSRAAVELDVGGAQVDVHSASLGSDLYRVHVDFPTSQAAPSVSFDREAGRLKVEQGQSTTLFPFGPNRGTHVRVQLDDQVAWAIDLSGGAFSGGVDASGVELTSMHVSGGAASLDIHVPAPKGKIALDFSGGAFDVTVHVPGGTEVQVTASGGANDVEVGGRHLGAFGDDTYTSPGYGSATDGYMITLSGGASHARVITG